MDALLAAASEEMMASSSASASASVSSSSSQQPSFSRHDNERFVNDDNDESSVDEHSSPPTNHVPFQLPIPTTAASRDGMNWQHMFQQLKDFQELGNRKVPSRMQHWMNAQRRRYKMYGIGVKKPTGIITNRIRQLNSIGFEWHVMTTTTSDSNSSSYNNHQAVKKYPGSPIHPRVILPPSYNPNGTAIFHEGRPVTSKKKVNTTTTTMKQHSLDHDAQVMLNIIHGRGYARGQPYSIEEDTMIERYQKQWGNKWSKMAKVFNNGRTDKDIHNRAASLLRARQRALHRSRHMMELESDNDDEESEDDDDDDESYNSGGGDRTGFVQKMVRAALAKERRGGRSLRHDFASSTTSDGTSSRRTRKPTRRVRESYNPLGHDGSYASEGEDDIHSSSARGSSNSNKPHALMSTPQGRKYFPDVLFQMVNDCSMSEPHVLDWIPDGTAFIVKEPSLMPSVLGRYFRHNNLSSMTRMCYMYGFSKYTSGPYVGAYVHPHFTKFVSRESLFHNVIKVGDHQSGGKKVPASKSKKVKHPKPSGVHRSDGIPRHALFSPKQPGRSNGDGAHSSSLSLFGGTTKRTKESKKKHLITAGPTRAERTEPTSNDILLTLKDDNYKEIMFTQFKIMGKKTKEESTDDVRKVAEQIFQSLVQQMRTNGGRFLRHTRGGGGTWYEAVDDDWALKKIANDFRRRMESSKHWYSESESADERNSVHDYSEPMVVDIEEEQDLISVQENDLVVSLKNPKYKKVMFYEFQLLGKRVPGESIEDLRVIAQGIFNNFKKLMGKKGRFFRKVRFTSKDGEDLYELLDEDEALDRMTQDLRRRMESAGNWLNVTLKNMHEVIAVKEKKAKKSKPKPKQTMPSTAGTGEVVPLAVMTDPQSNWNLGKLKDFSNVTYFKSDIFQGYVEQVVPRKTAGKKSADIYFLSPDGLRFRSMIDVRRHLESNPEVNHEESGSVMGYGEKEEDASLATFGDSEEGDNKVSGGDHKEHQIMLSSSSSMSEIEEKLPFLDALQGLVSYVDSKNPSVISWTKGGDAFYINDTSEAKLGPYLMKYFNHNNYNSLVIQLKNYGFTNPPVFGGAFHHPDFRRKSSTSRKRSAPLDDTEELRPRKRQATSQTLEDWKDTNTAKSSRKSTGKSSSLEDWKDTNTGKASRKSTGKSSSFQKDDAKKSAAKFSVNKGPVTFKCPYCSEDFTYKYPPTAKASFAHHTTKCKRTSQAEVDAESPATGKKSSPKKSLSSPKAKAKATPDRKKDNLEEKSPAKKQDFNPAVANDPTHSSSKSAENKTSSSIEDNDFVLSLKNTKYKAIMFAKFKELGERKGPEENPRLDELKYEMLSVFKQEVENDGRLLMSDRMMVSTWAVDDDDALEKIKMDLRRRNESSKHWLKE